MKTRSALFLSLLLPLSGHGAFTKDALRPKDVRAQAIFDDSAIQAFADDFGKSLDRLSLAMTVDPFQPIQFLQEANARQTKGDLDAAIRKYNEALKISPDDAALYVGRGAAHLKKGDVSSVKAAMADFDKACQFAPDNGNNFALRGATRLVLGDYRAGELDFAEATRLAPEDSELWSIRGAAEGAIVLVRHKLDTQLIFDRTYVTWKDGEFDPAMKSFARALEINPNNTSAFFCRGHLRMAKGDGTGALEDIQQAVKLAPGDSD
jgi:tetratricopeptide (TPR) repeat protein